MKDLKCVKDLKNVKDLKYGMVALQRRGVVFMTVLTNTKRNILTIKQNTSGGKSA